MPPLPRSVMLDRGSVSCQHRSIPMPLLNCQLPIAHCPLRNAQMLTCQIRISPICQINAHLKRIPNNNKTAQNNNQMLRHNKMFKHKTTAQCSNITTNCSNQQQKCSKQQQNAPNNTNKNAQNNNKNAQTNNKTAQANNKFAPLHCTLLYFTPLSSSNRTGWNSTGATRSRCGVPTVRSTTMPRKNGVGLCGATTVPGTLCSLTPQTKCWPRTQATRRMLSRRCCWRRCVCVLCLLCIVPRYRYCLILFCFVSHLFVLVSLFVFVFVFVCVLCLLCIVPRYWYCLILFLFHICLF